MNSNISPATPCIQVSSDVSQDDPTFVPIPREQAFSLLHGILGQLCAQPSTGTCYLAYGSAARELLNPTGVKDFGDIDILTIKPLEKAVEDVRRALKAMDVFHGDDGNGNFFLYVKGECFRLQLVDPVDGKKAFPGGFIRFNDSEFDESRCIQWHDPKNGPRVPCVPVAFLEPRGKGFYYLGDPKIDPQAGKRPVDVTPFEF